MDHFTRYLAEEVVEDHAGGRIGRRDALRVLGYLGIGGAGAAGLLDACSRSSTASPPNTVAASPVGTSPAGTSPAGTSPAGTSPAPTDRSATAPVPGEAITFPGPTGPVRGAWAPAPRARGAVLVIHENRGLTDPIKGVASRLAGDGYSALAPDLLSEDGGTAAVDPAQAPGLLGSAASSGRANADLRAALDELAHRQPGVKLAVIGFCFGGTLTWDLLAKGEARLAAAAPFYGSVPFGVSFGGSTAAVLAVYAGLDTRVNATQPDAVAGMEKAKLPHEVRVFPGVNHAFFNDTSPSYDATQARAAYGAVLDWFGRYLT